MVKVEIGSNDAGQRLDRFLRKYLKRAPLSAVYKIIRKDLKLNGKRAKEDTVLKEGDVLSLFIDDEKLSELTKDPPKRRAKRARAIPARRANTAAPRPIRRNTARPTPPCRRC